MLTKEFRMKCKKCGDSAWFFSLKRGLCKSCRVEAPSEQLKPIKHLPFKSNEAAFDYATEFLARPIAKEAVVFGLVVGEAESENLINLPTPKKWKVKIATDQGVYEIDRCSSISEAMQSKMGVSVNKIKVGDLVAVELSSYTPKLGIENENQIYLILMKLKPILSVEENVFLPDVQP